jgi:hypothetical protein
MAPYIVKPVFVWGYLGGVGNPILFDNGIRSFIPINRMFTGIDMKITINKANDETYQIDFSVENDNLFYTITTNKRDTISLGMITATNAMGAVALFLYAKRK